MKVLVLLSTYNGELFIREQIESILTQQNVETHLLVRDDGSSDQTCSILDELSYNKKNIEVVKSENVGFIRSFSILVELAQKYVQKVDYFAFSDQDDVWFKNKLIIACSLLEGQDNTKPRLFTSNSMMVDSKGNNIELFHAQYPIYTRGNVMIFGTEQGCSMVFNKKALEIYNSNKPSLTYHDRWMFQICYYLGSVIYEHNPLFYYRLHEGNTLANKKMMLIDRLRFYFSGKRLTKHNEMAAEFYSQFYNMLSASDCQLFQKYILYRRNFFCKLHVMFSRIFAPPTLGNHFKRMILLNKM